MTDQKGLFAGLPDPVLRLACFWIDLGGAALT